MILALFAVAAAHPVPPAFDAQGRAAFGPASVLRDPPDAGCSPRPARHLRWECPVEIGGVRLTTYFMVERGSWTGTLTTGVLTGDELLVVVAELEQSWGLPVFMENGDLAWPGSERIGGLHSEPSGDLYATRIVWADPRLVRP